MPSSAVETPVKHITTEAVTESNAHEDSIDLDELERELDNIYMDQTIEDMVSGFP